MSRGFRNSDETQAMSDKAIAEQIGRILDAGHEDGVAVDGRCNDCGRPIGAERLEALPSTSRCIQCQVEWEQGSGR